VQLVRCDLLCLLFVSAWEARILWLCVSWIAQWVKWMAMGWVTRVWFLAGEGIFLPLHENQLWGLHSLQRNEYNFYLSEVKSVECEAYHSPTLHLECVEFLGPFAKTEKLL
jgi:hypothetical protein